MATKKKTARYKMSRNAVVSTIDQINERLRDVNTHTSSPDEVEQELGEIADLFAILSDDLMDTRR
jgi:hypothetical protein